MTRLIVGLGNPGPAYRNTRHNAGFMAVDRVARRMGVAFEKEKYRGLVAEGRWAERKVLLLKPMTAMNLSGESVALAARNNIDGPDQLLVLYDDVDLPLGRLRLRKSGSAGTHNGMRSVLERLGSRDVPRLRMGVGDRSEGRDLTAHVLGTFRPEEWPVVEAMLDRAAEAALWCVEFRLDAVMNKVNRAPDTPQG